MNPKKTIVICFDLDETLVNSATKPKHLIDFNGSPVYGDASAWINFLTEIKRYCELHEFQLIVQIISVKKGGKPSDLVDAAALHLKPFLHNLNKRGEIISDDTPYSSNHVAYRFMTHLEDLPKQHLRLNRKKTMGAREIALFYSLDILPPIHLCYDNYAKNRFSKTLVLQTIAEHFEEPIPAENIFLLDNNLLTIKEVQTGLNGLTPCYQAMSAHILESLKYEPKKLRTLACSRILEEFKNKIIAQVLSVLENESALKSSKPSSLHCNVYQIVGSYLPFFKTPNPKYKDYKKTGPHLKID